MLHMVQVPLFMVNQLMLQAGQKAEFSTEVRSPYLCVSVSTPDDQDPLLEARMPACAEGFSIPEAASSDGSQDAQHQHSRMVTLLVVV